MTYVTHLLGGTAAGLALVQVSGALEPATIAYVAAGAAIGSLLPDIDHTKSKISNKNVGTSITSHIVSIFFKHRGFLHTPVFLAILFVAVYALAGMLSALDVLPEAIAHELPVFYLTAAVTLGALSHLILDSLTPGGIMWLWPVSKKRISFAPIRTNSIAEKIFAGAFAVLIGYMFLGQDMIPFM